MLVRASPFRLTGVPARSASRGKPGRGVAYRARGGAPPACARRPHYGLISSRAGLAARRVQHRSFCSLAPPSGRLRHVLPRSAPAASGGPVPLVLALLSRRLLPFRRRVPHPHRAGAVRRGAAGPGRGCSRSAFAWGVLPCLPVPGSCSRVRVSSRVRLPPPLWPARLGSSLRVAGPAPWAVPAGLTASPLWPAPGPGCRCVSSAPVLRPRGPSPFRAPVCPGARVARPCPPWPAFRAAPAAVSAGPGSGAARASSSSSPPARRPRGRSSVAASPSPWACRWSSGASGRPPCPRWGRVRGRRCRAGPGSGASARRSLPAPTAAARSPAPLPAIRSPAATASPWPRPVPRCPSRSTRPGPAPRRWGRQGVGGGPIASLPPAPGKGVCARKHTGQRHETAPCPLNCAGGVARQAGRVESSPPDQTPIGRNPRLDSRAPHPPSVPQGKRVNTPPG